MATSSRSLRLVLRTRRRSLLLEALEPRQLLANMAPSGTDTTITLPQNGMYVVQAADFGFSDSNDTSHNNFAAVKIDTLPTLGSLTDNQVPVVAGQIVPAVDLVAGKLKYTPAADGWGTPYSAFSFQVKDDGGTATGGVDIDPSPNTLTFNVVLVNIPPITPAADTFALATGGTLSGQLLQNDFDPQGKPLTAALASDVSHGTLTLNSNGTFTYTPAVGFAATDSFTYRASNGQTTSDTATVTINVAAPGANSAPATDSDQYYGLQGQTVNITPGVLTNDTDAEHDTLSAVLVDNAQHGTVTLNSNGSFRYVPAPSFAGQDHFTYRASDGQLMGNVATVGIDLFAIGPPPAINHAPAGTNETVAIAAGAAYTLSAADWGFSDAANTPANALMAVKITTLPAAGSLQLANAAVAAGQVVSISNINAGLLRFVAGADASGARYASFTFQVQDNGGTNNGGVDLDPTPNTLTFNVVPTPSVNHAPSGSDKTITLTPGSSYTLNVADWGFTDPSDTPSPNGFLTVRIVTLPVVGSLKLGGVPVVPGQVITAAAIANGLFQFVPAAGATGVPYAAFTFQVQDDGGTANGGVDLDPTPNTIAFNIAGPPINHAPNGADKTVTIQAGSSYTLQATDWGFSDSGDVQPNALAAIWISSLPMAGTLLLNNTAVVGGQKIPIANIVAGDLQFVPASGGTGTPFASFNFQVQDDGGTAGGGIDIDQTPNTLTFNVASSSSAPPIVPTADTFAVAAGGTLSGEVLRNDYDPQGKPLTAALATNVDHGTLTLNADGTFTYTPAAGFAATDSFTYRASNGQTTSEPATVTIHVAAAGANSAPATDSDQYYALQGIAINVTPGVLANDTDAEHDTLTAVLVANAEHGTVTLNADGSFRYAPASTFSGIDHFTYQASDGQLLGNVATASIVVFAFGNPVVNHAPSGTDKAVTTLEDTGYTASLADFGFTDSGDTPSNNLLAVRIAALPAAGSLTLEGMPVALGQFIPAAAIVQGKLRFAPAINGNGAPYASLAFQVQDDGGTAGGGVDLDPTPNTLTFNVLAVNDPPSFVKGDDQTATDESGSVTVPGWARHLSTGAENEAGQTLAFTIVSIDQPELFAVLPVIDAAGNLTFTPQPNSSGMATIVISLADNGGTANGGSDTGQPQSLLITIDKPHVLHNTEKPMDVNGDGHVVARDALEIINYINAFGSGPAAPRESAAAATSDKLFYDVNGDGFISPVDALKIINQINAFGAGEGESAALGGSAGDWNDTETLIALDVVSQYKSRDRRP